MTPLQTPSSPAASPTPETDVAPLDPGKSGPSRSLWRRYVTDPVVDQLKQGITPEKIALTVAVGAAVGVFPVLGTTTILCAAVGFLLKLNQPVLQLVNYLMYPAQLALILGFIRFGEWIYGAPRLALSMPGMLEKFHASPSHFFQEFAATFLHCITAWLLVAPVAMTILYFVVLPILRTAARRSAR